MYMTKENAVYTLDSSKVKYASGYKSDREEGNFKKSSNENFNLIFERKKFSVK